MLAFVLIALREPDERKVVEELSKYKEIKNIYILFGEWDLLAEIEIETAEELGTFVMEKIRSRPDIKLTSTMIVASK